MENENHLIRQGIIPEFWLQIVRPAVLKRDNYLCRLCGEKKKKLHVHHIVKGIQVYDNLISLCGSCHIKVHNRMRRRLKYLKDY